MPAIITDRFRIHNSEQFQEAFSEGSGNTMYLGIGRPQAFATSKDFIAQGCLIGRQL